MTKTQITPDEWYPVFILEQREPYDWEGPAFTHEVPDELIDRYHKALAEWDAVQAQLRSIVDG